MSDFYVASKHEIVSDPVTGMPLYTLINLSITNTIDCGPKAALDYILSCWLGHRRPVSGIETEKISMNKDGADCVFRGREV